MTEDKQAELRPMNERYWDSVSENYEDEITSVFYRDSEALVKHRVEVAGNSNPQGNAADLGCGVGNFVPLLSKVFGHVDACDWSETGLRHAREKCILLKNTAFHKIDLSRDLIPFGLVDFALCVNVLIMPELEDRLCAWGAVTNQVEAGGTLLLVVPSHESAQMELYNGLEQCLNDGDTCLEGVVATQDLGASASDLQLGVYSVNGTRTKHYLKQELRMMLSSHQFDILEIVRIVYRKDEDHPISESWDWLIVAQRKNVL